METKLKYTKPTLKTWKISLGVFGYYGESDGSPGGNIDPSPVKIVNPFDFTIE